MNSGLSPLQRTGKHPLSRNGWEDRPTDRLTARMNGSIQVGSETRMYKNPWRRERATIVVLFSFVIGWKTGKLFAFTICGVGTRLCEVTPQSTFNMQKVPRKWLEYRSRDSVKWSSESYQENPRYQLTKLLLEWGSSGSVSGMAGVGRLELRIY